MKKKAKVKLSQKKIKMLVQAYDPIYANNPVAAALHHLFNNGEIQIDLNDRNRLADAIVDFINQHVTTMGIGAPQTRCVQTYLKGQMRADVLRSRE